MRFHALVIVILLISHELTAQYCPSQDRVLWVGDSWSEIQWDNLILRDVFDQFGHDDKNEYDNDPTGAIDPNQTAISGMTAYSAADPASAPNYYDYPTRITNTLNSKPGIDIVLISLGGNDLIGGGWFAQGYPAYHNNVAANNTAIVNNINTVAQAALAVRPDIEVVLYGYDYVGLWEYVLRNISNLADPIVFTWVVTLGNPPAGPFYDDLLDLETRKKALADGHPRIHYVNNLGTMQYIHGHDTANWGAGITPRPDGANFPATPSASIIGQGRVGTDRFGEPVGVQIWRSNTDWIHLSDSAYRELCINATTQYFFPKFRGASDASFVSESPLDGYVRGAGGSGNATDGTLGRMGDQDSTNTYRTILSFDTNTLPDNATITKASIYMSRSAANGTNPFQGALGGPILDVATGSFGTTALAATDFQAAATASNIGCFTGSVSGTSYFVRVDVQPAGLAAINSVGRTQFRLYFPNANSGADHVSFNDGGAANTLLRPFVDIWFTTPTPTPTATPSASPTASPTNTATATPSPTAMPSVTPSPTSTATSSPTATISASPTPNLVRGWTVFE